MKQDLIILEEDKAWARARIAELEKAIQDLGPEFYDVFNQSSETWHDNAPFDALRDRQSVLDAELQSLRRVLQRSMPSMPAPKKGAVGIGHVVALRDKKGRTKQFKIAGHWTATAGQANTQGIVVVSSQTPLAEELIGKAVGDETKFGTIEAIE